MSETQTAHPAAQSLAKGMLAGLIGGLVATAAKTLMERMYPPRKHGEPEPPAAFTATIAGHALAPDAEAAAAEGIHWAFGAVAGAAYGALAEFYPAAASKDGASFGLALGGLMHEGALPALGIPAPQGDQSLRERTSELSSHVVYGMVTENVRRFVRKLL